MASLVVGADGLIGRALVDHLAHVGEERIGTTRRPDTISDGRIFLDLSEEISEWRPPRQVSVVYLCAAVTALKRCRMDPAASGIVNIYNTVALAKLLIARKTFVVAPSTNLVFDGSVPFRKADDPLCPTTEYGRQKAEAHRQLLDLGVRISIVRLSKVIGPNMPLITGWIQALKNNEAIHPVSNMVIAPVALSFAVQVLHRVAERRMCGIIQVSPEEDVTYEQIARHIARRIGADSELVQAIRWEEAGLDLEAVPSHTTLDTTRLRTELGIEPYDVWSVIDSVFGL